MRRKLLIFNIALLVAAGAGLWRFRVEQRRALERYKILRAPAAPTITPPPPQAAPPPVQPANFLDVAGKYLFSPDRNPTVAIEPPKVKPRPALPQLFGVMNIGGGPIALMAPGPNTRHKTVRIGETIGEFKLLAAAPDHLVLEWDGQKIDAPVADLMPRPAAEAAQGSDSGGGGGTPAGGGGGAPATVINPNAQGNRPGEYQIGPAVQGASGVIYQSLPGDTAPHGTVYQNKRKVVRTTPFGQQAWWEDVKQ